MKCSYTMIIILTATAVLDRAENLFCYDSTGQKANFPRECEPNKKMCYSEYVAIRLYEGYYLHEFDRFCAYSADCEQRGIQDQCLSMDELDPEVLATFVVKLSNSGYKEADVKYSRFCCCSSNLCNDFDISKAMKKYNITENKPSSGNRLRLLCSNHWFTYLSYLFLMFCLFNTQ